MAFKFEVVEGLDEDLVATLNANTALIDSISGYVTTAAESRNDVSKKEWKKKMDALDAKKEVAETRVAELEALNIDPDEIKALREARDKSPELQATLDAMKGKYEAAEQTNAKQAAEMLEMKLETTLASAVTEYNAQNPTYPIPASMQKYVRVHANGAFKYDEDAKGFRVFDKNGDIVATDKGVATPVDWLVMQRTVNPELFSAPSGGGAPGSSTNGSADKVISRVEFDKLSPVRKSEVVGTHQIID